MNRFDGGFGKDSRNDGFADHSGAGYIDDADFGAATQPDADHPAEAQIASGAPQTIPEPINISGNGMEQRSFRPQMTPRPDMPADRAQEDSVFQETVVRAEMPLPSNDDAADYVCADAPAEAETPAPADNRSPAEKLAEYADCRSKFIPAGTDIAEVNRKYQYALHYGAEWGYSTVILPVSQELADALCGDSAVVGAVRSARMMTLERPAQTADPGELERLYARKTAVIEKNGISVGQFENAEVEGAAINCFSSFVRNGKTTRNLLLLQVPVSEPWRVFEWIPVGGIAGVPSNDLLTAASRQWFELCGAIPAVLGYGVAEFFVPNGFPGRQTALKIAREQFALCHERVLRLTRSHTLSELADTLTKSCVWYLGWNEH
jgi:hypothetical protein